MHLPVFVWGYVYALVCEPLALLRKGVDKLKRRSTFGSTPTSYKTKAPYSPFPGHYTTCALLLAAHKPANHMDICLPPTGSIYPVGMN